VPLKTSGVGAGRACLGAHACWSVGTVRGSRSTFRKLTTLMSPERAQRQTSRYYSSTALSTHHLSTGRSCRQRRYVVLRVMLVRNRRPLWIVLPASRQRREAHCTQPADRRWPGMSQSAIALSGCRPRRLTLRPSGFRLPGDTSEGWPVRGPEPTLGNRSWILVQAQPWVLIDGPVAQLSAGPWAAPRGRTEPVTGGGQ